MTDLTRRDVLAAGLAVPAASLFASVARAQDAPSQGRAVPMLDGAITAIGPREQLLFDFDWKLPVAIRLTPDRREIRADGEDVVVLTVDALDEQGRRVPTANHKLAFNVAGAGALIGVGNGDPNCHESDKAPRRSLFNGLAQVIVQAARTPGQIVIEAVSDGAAPNLSSARISIDAKAAPLRPSVGQ